MNGNSRDTAIQKRLIGACFFGGEFGLRMGIEIGAFTLGGMEEKEFGGQVLHLLVKRSPRSKLAKDAKSKLKSAGLE